MTLLMAFLPVNKRKG